jgi:hypothetical protein
MHETITEFLRVDTWTVTLKIQFLFSFGFACGLSSNQQNSFLFSWYIFQLCLILSMYHNVCSSKLQVLIWYM